MYLQIPQPTPYIGRGQLTLQTISCQGQELNLANVVSATLAHLPSTVFRLICTIWLTLIQSKNAPMCTFLSVFKPIRNICTANRRSWTFRRTAPYKSYIVFVFYCNRRFSRLRCTFISIDLKISHQCARAYAKARLISRHGSLSQLALFAGRVSAMDWTRGLVGFHVG